MSKIKPGSMLLPIKYLRITDQEWQHIRYLLQKKREDETEQLEEIKKRLWGN